MTKLVEKVDAEKYFFHLRFGRAAMLSGAGSGPAAGAL